MRNWKSWLGLVILVGLAVGTAQACLYCIPCGEGGEHACIAAPSPPCICFREGSVCVAYECPDGDTADACCINIARPTAISSRTVAPLPDDKTRWRITYNNGFQLNFGKKNPPKGFDPLKEVALRFPVEKKGKRLIPVTAVKLESWGETR